MRSALSDILDGAIGFIEPSPPVAAPSKWKNADREPAPKSTMAILRDRVLEIVKASGPLTQHELLLRFRRKWGLDARFSRNRVARALDGLRASGQVTATLLCDRHGDGRLAVFEVPSE